MKLMLCLLTSGNISRLNRLVDNTANELIDNGFFELFPIIVVNTLSDIYYQEVLAQKFPYPVVRTQSNGYPGKGKNSCFDLFLSSDCDYLTQFDGDDILYPTYLLSLEKHLKHYGNIDVLGLIPVDVLDTKQPAGHGFPVAEGVYGGVWGTSQCSTRDFSGPGRNDALWDSELPMSIDFIILQSRKCAKVKMDEILKVGEDHLYSLQLLGLHQKGELLYCQSMSSDLFVVDRTTENSVQKQFPQRPEVKRLKELARTVVKENRSSFNELPMIYKPLLLDQYQKEAWIIKFYATTAGLYNI
tara:strand:+ start:1106 stop:2005 length:900 start_codon:yes stop_codon:yes gene_type:complete